MSVDAEMFDPAPYDRADLDPVLADQPMEALRRLADPVLARRSETGASFRCDECGCLCTRGPSGTEYGHRKKHYGYAGAERCSKRTSAVDAPAGRGAYADDQG